ncbi:PIN domain-containing protein [Enterobacter sp.]|uniref:PIN domain-containing protein n=1 Tax=Enterobacter sp. TaxID=42895 RepID=UPI00296F9B65|nr:PIN domain-containing protein [Enterobacter sp.]
MAILKRIYAFVDYENLGGIEKLTLSNYEKIIIFTGPHQDTVKLPTSTLGRDLCIHITQVPSVSKNNVDFHLVLELGKLNETLPKEIVFHVVSRDKGYDGVIDHLNKTGRVCLRLSLPSHTPIIENESKLEKEVTDCVQELCAFFKKSKNNRPGTLVALSNVIKSRMKKSWTESRDKIIKQEFIRMGVMHVNGNAVTWKF